MVADMPARPVVLIMMDDIGTEYLSPYGLGGPYADTPNIDALAAAGQIWRDAYAMPVCSSTRASLLTGHYPYDHGIGYGVEWGVPGLPGPYPIIPALVDVPTAIFGKWHLGAGPRAALDAGFDHAVVTEHNLKYVGDYYEWWWYDNGEVVAESGYVPMVTTDRAIQWLAAQPPDSPFFLMVAYHLAHVPFHCPPGMLCDGTNKGMFVAMMAQLDREIGRLLGAVGDDALIILLGDNGSQIEQAPYPTGKGSIYQGGVRVPLIFAGDGVWPDAEQETHVSVVDLFPTILTALGVEPPDSRGINLLPLVYDGGYWPRAVYSELFAPYDMPRGLGEIHNQAAWVGRYKLIRQLDKADELYDLFADPYEQDNLLPGPLTNAQEEAWQVMSDYMDGTDD